MTTASFLSVFYRMMSLIDEQEVRSFFFQFHYCVRSCYSDETTKLHTSQKIDDVENKNNKEKNTQKNNKFAFFITICLITRHHRRILFSY